ncbi:hypothetical protein CJJ09_004865 [Candidozyma auris]|nr:hypothetical protein CJJ09_004865 [[Candida] auris]
MNRFKIDLWGFKVDLKLLGDIFFLTGAGLSMYYMLSHLLGDTLDSSVKNKQSKKNSANILKKIQAANPELKKIQLNEHERMLLNSLVTPDDITTGFDDVGALSPSSKSSTSQ